jgi:hypothetical protein
MTRVSLLTLKARTVLVVCFVVAGGLVLSGAQALAASSAPEAPITKPCSIGPVVPGGLRLCGTLNPHASAKVG